MTQHLLSAPLALLLSASASAQGAVWVVDEAGGPGSDFTKISEAVDAAQGGDTILVRSGDYDAFPFSGKALEVVADTGASVQVRAFTGTLATSEIIGTPAGTTTVVRGVSFVANAVAPDAYAYFALRAKDCQGTLWFEDCEFLYGPLAPLILENCADVVLVGCVTQGYTGWFSTSGSVSSSPGLSMNGGRLTIYAGSFTGGNGRSGLGFPSNSDPYPGMPGIHIQAGEVFLASGQAIGGAGGKTDPFANPCQTPADGGPGLWMGAGLVRLADASLVGGAKGDTALGCPQGSPGPPSSVQSGSLVTLGGIQSTLTSNSPVREGRQLTLTLQTVTGQPLTALLLAGQATAPVFSAGVSGVSVLGGPTRRVKLGNVDPLTGTVTFNLTIPEIGPGVLAAPWIFQAYVCDSGGCTAGAATHTLWLDSSL